MNTPTPRTDRQAVVLMGKTWTASYVEMYEHARTLERELAALTAERDQLRDEVERLSALGSWAHTCIHHTDEERKAWAACPCCAIARAERAEADAAAYLKRAESFSKLADEAEAEAERYRLVTLRQDAELAAEREKLDWVFQNCKVEANDYTTGNRDVYYVHDREDLGVAMKEDAK